MLAAKIDSNNWANTGQKRARESTGEFSCDNRDNILPCFFDMRTKIR